MQFSIEFVHFSIPRRHRFARLCARAPFRPRLASDESIINAMQVTRLQLNNRLQALIAASGAVERRQRCVLGVIRVNELDFVVLVRVIVGVPRHRAMILSLERLRVTNDSKHALAVHEAKRIHDSHCRP